MRALPRAELTSQGLAMQLSIVTGVDQLVPFFGKLGREFGVEGQMKLKTSLRVIVWEALSIGFNFTLLWDRWVGRCVCTGAFSWRYRYQPVQPVHDGTGFAENSNATGTVGVGRIPP